MYLQDYQILGGIFLPLQVLKCDIKRQYVMMRGTLILNNKDFYITIITRHNRLTKITKVAGKSPQEAINNKKQLNQIRAHGIHTNTGGLRSYVLKRGLRFLLWLLVTLGYLLCAGLCIINIAKWGFRCFPILILVTCLLLFFICLCYKDRLIQERLGLKTNTEEHY